MRFTFIGDVPRRFPGDGVRPVLEVVGAEDRDPHEFFPGDSVEAEANPDPRFFESEARPKAVTSADVVLEEN